MGNHKPPRERSFAKRTGVDSRIEGRARGLGRGPYYFRGLPGLEAKLQVQKEECQGMAERAGTGMQTWVKGTELREAPSRQLLPLDTTQTQGLACRRPSHETPWLAAADSGSSQVGSVLGESHSKGLSLTFWGPTAGLSPRSSAPSASCAWLRPAGKQPRLPGNHQEVGGHVLPVGPEPARPGPQAELD